MWYDSKNGTACKREKAAWNFLKMQMEGKMTRKLDCVKAIANKSDKEIAIQTESSQSRQ